MQTDDGYILTLHRIARPGAIPVLLVHGLLDSSATWVMMGPNKGLGRWIKGYHLPELHTDSVAFLVPKLTCSTIRGTTCGWPMCAAIRTRGST